MLEPQIAADTAQEILRVATEGKAIKVASVKLSIGSMRQLDEELFLQNLADRLKGTPAEGASVTVERTPTTMRCSGCGEVYPVVIGEPTSYVCPSCGCTDRTLASGMELYISDMQAIVAGESIADKLAKAVEDALGPVEPQA